MKVVQLIVGVIVLGLLAVGVWSQMQTQAANKIVDAANAASNAANQMTQEAAAIYTELIKDDVVKALPGNRAEIKAKVDQAASLFEKSAAQFTEAAAKLEEATGKVSTSVLIDYWKVRIDALKKRAAQKATLGKIVRLLTEESVIDFETFNARYKPLVDEANKFNAESEEAEAKASKIQADNKDKIQQN